MSIANMSRAAPRRRRFRWDRLVGELGLLAVGALLLIWWFLPIYNMFLIALDPDGRPEFSGYIWPPHPTLMAFEAVLFKGYWYLEDFWHQLGNSFYIGIATMLLTVFIGSLASFALSRMRLHRSWAISTSALVVYAIPQYFLVVPYYRLMHSYGLMDSLWSVIFADVTFAVPYALLILIWYSRLIPVELDDAARIDGASPLQVYWRIYMPLMAPALAAVGTYALLVAWNEYLYQFLLLSSHSNKTVAITIAEFFENDDSPWNFMVAAAIVYSLPPIAVFYALRRYMAAGLTRGGVKA
ncbi:MAG TPA: carbohydrate ABC transporter permease [Stellaceae bacterium]|nr:carbohydrate ABC transporter permease [Stellaceae bacterium]